MVPKLLPANFCIESIPVNKENLASSGRTQVLAQPLLKELKFQVKRVTRDRQMVGWQGLGWISNGFYAGKSRIPVLDELVYILDNVVVSGW